jgi:hypothetical protein
VGRSSARVGVTSPVVPDWFAQDGRRPQRAAYVSGLSHRIDCGAPVVCEPSPPPCPKSANSALQSGGPRWYEDVESDPLFGGYGIRHVLVAGLPLSSQRVRASSDAVMVVTVPQEKFGSAGSDDKRPTQAGRRAATTVAGWATSSEAFGRRS